MKKVKKEISFSWLFLQLFFCVFVLVYISASAGKPLQRFDQVKCVNIK